MIRPRLQGSRSRIARARDSIPDRDAPVRFIGRRRLKLALQDRAFLHLLARSEMAEGINAVRVPALSDGVMRVQASAIPAQDSLPDASIQVENGQIGALRNARDSKSAFSKKSILDNGLWKSFRVTRVLFVQHPSKKAVAAPVWGGSFVACAECIGNCDGATEGGIPRSPRF